MIIRGLDGTQYYKPHLVFRNGEWHGGWRSLDRSCWAAFGARGRTLLEAYRATIWGFGAWVR